MQPNMMAMPELDLVRLHMGKDVVQTRLYVGGRLFEQRTQYVKASQRSHRSHLARQLGNTRVMPKSNNV